MSSRQEKSSLYSPDVILQEGRPSAIIALPSSADGKAKPHLGSNSTEMYRHQLHLLSLQMHIFASCIVSCRTSPYAVGHFKAWPWKSRACISASSFGHFRGSCPERPGGYRTKSSLPASHKALSPQYYEAHVCFTGLVGDYVTPLQMITQQRALTK